MRSVFRKENVFTCLIFGAIFIFAVVQTINPADDLALIACMLSIFIFLISILKLVVTILEDIIEKETEALKQEEDGLFNYDYSVLSSEKIQDIRNSKSGIPEDILSEIKTKANAEKNLDEIKKYKTCFDMRERFRSIRRVFLWFYYAIFGIILVTLLLRTEISNAINIDSVRLLDTNIITMWSLVIILIEIMMKDMIEQIIINVLEKIYKIEFGIW